MVDKNLVKKLKEKMEGGADSISPDDLPLMLDFFTQLANENEEIQEEIADADVRIQMILSDVDKKFWFRVEDAKMNWGEGEIEKPTITVTTTAEIGTGMFFGEADATSAYMAGDITVEGNLPDAMFLQSVIELSIEILQKLTGKL